MPSDVTRGKGYTAPKGRPTVRRNAGRSSRRLSSTVEWVIAIAVFLAVLGAVFYFGRDVRSGGTGGTTLPAPATLTVDLVS